MWQSFHNSFTFPNFVPSQNVYNLYSSCLQIFAHYIHILFTFPDKQKAYAIHMSAFQKMYLLCLDIYFPIPIVPSHSFHLINTKWCLVTSSHISCFSFFASSFEFLARCQNRRLPMTQSRHHK